ncbi:MAG: universal stress protein [Hyphomicrobiaceae bacterium TMED74]|nr:universal stress protein UspA [Filomicrobium sp.]RPG34989.1 MAG: universal stress protein [Hyphomicrobiaceae bacterium TMED74]
MFKHILIATDGSELSELAVDQGLDLAKAMSASVTVVTVTEPHPVVGSFETTLAFPTEEYEKGAELLASKRLAHVAEKAAAMGVTCNKEHVKDVEAAEGILQTAEQRQCDVIIMSTRSRRGLSRMLLGSQANKVVTQSPIPVLVCPPPA